MKNIIRTPESKTRLLIILLLIFMSFLENSYSQEKSNKFLLGGEIGCFYVNNSNSDFSAYLGDATIGFAQDLNRNINSFNYKEIGANLSPSLLFYLNDQFLIGCGIEWYTYRKNIDDDIFQTLKENQFLVNLMSRFYFYNSFFIQGQFDYGVDLFDLETINLYPSYTGNSTNYSLNNNGIVTGFGISGGYSFILGQSTVLDIALKYMNRRSKLNIETPRITEGSYKNIHEKILFTVALRYRK